MAAELKPVPDKIAFPKMEEDMMEHWARVDAFKNQLRQSEGKPEYSFYDGPPFATGSPHYGHILAGTIKDVRTRFAHQSGFHVPRNFGWDCHGLPVEFEIEKMLGIKVRSITLPVTQTHAPRVQPRRLRFNLGAAPDTGRDPEAWYRQVQRSLSLDRDAV